MGFDEFAVWTLLWRKSCLTDFKLQLLVTAHPPRITLSVYGFRTSVKMACCNIKKRTFFGALTTNGVETDNVPLKVDLSMQSAFVDILLRLHKWRKVTNYVVMYAGLKGIMDRLINSLDLSRTGLIKVNTVQTRDVISHGNVWQSK